MSVPLISIDEVQKGRGGKTKGEKYAKYAQSIAKDVAWLKEQISISSDKKIRLKVRDIASSMGPEFAKKSDTAIYWGLKFVLFHEGIVVDTGTAKDKSKLLVMRYALPDDKLPPSLAKVLEPPEEEMPEPGEEET
jgi:hypothetical protein